MKKRIGILGAIVLGIVFVTAGLSGKSAMADVGQEVRADFKQLKADLKELRGDLRADRQGDLRSDFKNIRADFKDLRGDIKGTHKVPEPSPLILLGIGLAGLAAFEIWKRRKSSV